MSDFLGNLAARSRGTLETIRPRVPSRFEPVRKSDGALAGRAPAKEEGLESNAEMEARGDVETPLSFEPKRTSAREVDSTSTRARHTPAEADAPRIEKPEQRATVEPGQKETVSSVEPKSAQKQGSGEQRTQNKSARQTQPAQSLKPSSAQMLDSGRIVAPSVRVPASREQRNARRDQDASRAAFISAIEPLAASSRTGETHAQDDEIPMVKSLPANAAPSAPEPLRTFGSFAEVSRNESVSGNEARRRWPWDAALKPEPITRPAPGDKPQAFAPPSERATAEKPMAPNRQPAKQRFAAEQAHQSEPSVRVTIGRVEVRAVFPEQPVKRSPPPRFRPSVTLDDYLNRGSGARR